MPPCTRRLVPGIAQAEDTDQAGISYGQLRCSQVAALAARFEGRPISDRSLTAALAELGLDVHAVEKVRS